MTVFPACPHEFGKTVGFAGVPAVRAALALAMLLAVSSLAAAAPDRGTSPTSVAAWSDLAGSVEQARVDSSRAIELERLGDSDGALAEFRRVVDALQQARSASEHAPARELGMASTPPAARRLPPVSSDIEALWVLAAARVDFARAWLLASLPTGARGQDLAAWEANLARAEQELIEAVVADRTDARIGGRFFNDGTWKIQATLAWARVLAGDTAGAREAAEAAQRLEPENYWTPLLDEALVALENQSARSVTARSEQFRNRELIEVLRAVRSVGSLVAASSPTFAPPEQPRTRGIAAASAPLCPAVVGGNCYPVWFGTDRKPIDSRAPDHGFTGDPDDHVHYGKRFVFIPRSHRTGELGSPLWKRLLSGVDDRISIGAATHFDASAFDEDIRMFLRRLDPADNNVLVYIHGFNVTFDDAARRAAQLGFDLGVPGVTAFYSWPSRGRAAAYLSDSASIQASERHIADFLVRMASLVDRGNVHIIAHSMGNRGLLRAMERITAEAATRSGVRFGSIFLAAPDVNTAIFRRLAAVYPEVAEHTTLYVGDADRALAAIEWFTNEPRAGSAPPLLLMPGIDTIRVPGRSLFRLGHSYVAEDLNVVRDIATLLRLREGPEQRRRRNGWPVPDPSARGSRAWLIGP